MRSAYPPVVPATNKTSALKRFVQLILPVSSKAGWLSIGMEKNHRHHKLVHSSHDLPKGCSSRLYIDVRSLVKVIIQDIQQNNNTGLLLSMQCTFKVNLVINSFFLGDTSCRELCRGDFDSSIIKDRPIFAILYRVLSCQLYSTPPNHDQKDYCAFTVNRILLAS